MPASMTLLKISWTLLVLGIHANKVLKLAGIFDEPKTIFFGDIGLSLEVDVLLELVPIEIDVFVIRLCETGRTEFTREAVVDLAMIFEDVGDHRRSILDRRTQLSTGLIVLFFRDQTKFFSLHQSN